MKTNNDVIYYELVDGLGNPCVFMNTERSQRIAKVLYDNLNDLNKSLLEKTIGYCSSLVDSQMAREEKANNSIKKSLDKTEDIKMNKAKMTRQQATEALIKHMPGVFEFPEGLIDFYIEAGMLEIVEEKTITERLIEIFKYESCSASGVLTALDKYGLKIVEK